MRDLEQWETKELDVAFRRKGTYGNAIDNILEQCKNSRVREVAPKTMLLEMAVFFADIPEVRGWR